MNVVTLQRKYFEAHRPQSLKSRLHALSKLQRLLEDHESRWLEALRLDLHKPKQEALLTEFWFVLDELHFVRKHLSAWMKPQSMNRILPWSLFGHGEIHYEARGSVLVIGTWNYPLALLASPLLGALAAGNSVILKPSEHASHTANLWSELIPKYFPKEMVTVMLGDGTIANELIDQEPDHIFYTGGERVARLLAARAAKHLIPLTLELGGKSPCIVDETANITLAASRIAWAKTLNAGQVCIAPDVLYVHESVKEPLIDAISKLWKERFGDNAKESPDYARIISEAHTARLATLLEDGAGRIRYGGQVDVDARYVAPTLIDEVPEKHPLRLEEIFGPILPVVAYTDFSKLLPQFASRAHPLALYYFSNKPHAEILRDLSRVSFGGGCINDCVMQISHWHLPFGGTGYSGIGSYHGFASFENFSYRKSLYIRRQFFDYPFIYPPYSEKSQKWLRRLLRIVWR